MDFTFADDARQGHPSRRGMGALVSVGGIHVPDASVQRLEAGLRAACREYGFGPQDRFKWSPRPGLWMAQNLVDERRAEFFEVVLGQAYDLGVKATVVIVDDTCQPANAGLSAEKDALTLFLERVELRLHECGAEGVVIVDRPSGGRAEEGTFILECAEMLASGTRYVQHERIALNVLSSSSDHSRCIQLADLVTSCTLARVGGEYTYTPRIFRRILPLFCRDETRIGGKGLKIHPDFKYVNLYHWLAGDEYVIRGNVGTPLPLRGIPYLYPDNPDPR